MKQLHYITHFSWVNMYISEIHTFSTTSISVSLQKRYPKILKTQNQQGPLSAENKTVAPQQRQVSCNEEKRRRVRFR